MPVPRKNADHGFSVWHPIRHGKLPACRCSHRFRGRPERRAISQDLFLSGFILPLKNWGQKITRPLSLSTAPGAPSPMCREFCFISRSHSSTTSVTQWAIRSITTSETALGFGAGLAATEALELLRKKHRRESLVPPRSTPHDIFLFCARFQPYSLLRCLPLARHDGFNFDSKFFGYFVNRTVTVDNIENGKWNAGVLNCSSHQCLIPQENYRTCHARGPMSMPLSQ